MVRKLVAAAEEKSSYFENHLEWCADDRHPDVVVVVGGHAVVVPDDVVPDDVVRVVEGMRRWKN